MTDHEEFEENFIPKPTGYHFRRPDRVLRPGREHKAEFRYRGNSTCAPKADHPGKGKTLRHHRQKQNLPKTRYKSIVLWPKEAKLGRTPNVSEDIHNTKKQAEHFCELLKKRGLGGEGKIFPLSTRIKPCK